MYRVNYRNFFGEDTFVQFYNLRFAANHALALSKEGIKSHVVSVKQHARRDGARPSPKTNYL